MIEAELIWIDPDGVVRLTEKALWHLEEHEHLVQVILYGYILQSPRDKTDVYQRCAETITNFTSQQPKDAEGKARLLLKRLRRLGHIDYTRNRVWSVRRRSNEQPLSTVAQRR